MKVILLNKVTGLGNLGDLVDVKPGYARNFLLPKGHAAEATKANLERFEARRAELEKQQAARLADSEARAAAFAGKVLTISVKAGDEGRIFGSVGSQQIVDAAKAQGLTLARPEINVPNGNIRELGEFTVGLHFFGDVKSEVVVRVVAA